jgi:NAD(P)-dependent dehydrogenase (short-subunit alcohol dehydrogenase family)
MSSVKKFNDRVRADKKKFDVVVLNAGVLIPPKPKTDDDHATVFQVNYLSQYLIIHSIIENQRGSEKELKVVTLTSVMHKLCGPILRIKPTELEFTMDDPNANPWVCYAWSKFAMALLAQSLSKIEGVKAFTVHPGAVRTGMIDSIRPGLRKRLNKFGHMLINPVSSTNAQSFQSDPSGNRRRARLLLRQGGHG